MAKIKLQVSADYKLIAEAAKTLETFPSEFSAWEQDFIEDLYERALSDPYRYLTDLQRDTLNNVMSGD